MKKFFVLLSLVCGLSSRAQFAPPVGQAGTTAISKDSSVFISWANGCTIVRGYQDISNPSLGYANVGDSSMATGIPGPGIVSLGDNGSAILTFNSLITDGLGPDFAVFENSFSDSFLELAFVEVSSDGINYFRFPATSNTQDIVQTESFGSTDATLINNLAGKYRGGYGTPFDLQELAGTMGLDIHAVTHVKIVDVIGSINPLYSNYDKNGNKVNDPWPTGFGSSGFDLDAVGIINGASIGIKEQDGLNAINIYPNPASSFLYMDFSNKEISLVQIQNTLGQVVLALTNPERKVTIDVKDFQRGLYFVEVILGSKKTVKKILIQ